MQYVAGHVEEYMERMGSSKSGVVTTVEGLEAANARNPWLVIEAWPTIHPLLGHTNPSFNLSACLKGSLPEDCIFCMNSLSPPSGTFMKTVVQPHRVLEMYHYLIPNVRIIEMSPHNHTDVAVTRFLARMIPFIGSLPIITKNDECALAFQQTWLHFRQEMLDLLDEDTSCAAVDDAWEIFLRETSAEELESCFLDVSKRFGAFVESRYMTIQYRGQPVLSQLKDIFSNAAEFPPPSPYNSLGVRLPDNGMTTKVSATLHRVGPDIYFVNIEVGPHLRDGPMGLGKILCNSPDLGVRVLVEHLSLPYDLDIHFATETIYWTDLMDYNITACNLAGESKRVIVPKSGRHAPAQIMIDQVASQIYWTHYEGAQILRSNLDGTCIEVVFETSVSRPLIPGKLVHAFSLDPARRQVCWSQPQPESETNYCILRTSMDLPPGSTGADRRDIEIIFDNLPEVFDIDFVPVFDELYWSAYTDSTRMAMEVRWGDIGPCETYRDEKHNVVLRNLQDTKWLRVDPQAGHVYTTSFHGVLARFDMTTGKNG